MRIMGIDYGDARTGIALSDLLCSIVGSTCVVPSRNKEKLMADIVRIAKENAVTTVVVGLPKNMDGSKGFRADACEELGELLKSFTEIPVTFWDERLTTVSAHRILSDNNVRGKKRKNVVDAVSADIILQDFIDFRKNKI